eukprot:gene18447-24154_t
MSWSENRSSNKNIEPPKKRLEKLSIVNGVLKKLSEDDDLHDDLKFKNVQVAINHWTGVKRLNAQDVTKLFENRRVVYVYQRVQMIQHACLTAGIPVPFDHFVNKKDHLNFKVTIKYFGFDIIEDSDFPKDIYKQEVADYLNEIKIKETNTKDLSNSENTSSNNGNSDLNPQTQLNTIDKLNENRVKVGVNWW